jgi:hypothetical protein
MRPAAVSAVFALSLVAGAACAGRGAFRCPGEVRCDPVAVAGRLVRVGADTSLGCPLHVTPEYAEPPAEGALAGAGSAALLAGVDEAAVGHLHERRTRRLQAESDATGCCYHWAVACID